MCPAAAPAALRPWPGGRARGQRGGVLGHAAELDADGIVGLLADHAGAHEDVGDRARELDVGGGGDEPGALGDHLARVRRPAEAGDAVDAEGLVEQRRGRQPVGRDEALGHRDHRRARRQPGGLEVADHLREPARGDAEEDVVGAREPGRHRLHAQLAREASRRAGRPRFWRSSSSCEACSAVRVCSVVRKPPRASRTATAVPNEPAPSTTARRPPGDGRFSCGRGGIAGLYPGHPGVVTASARGARMFP